MEERQRKLERIKLRYERKREHERIQKENKAKPKMSIDLSKKDIKDNKCQSERPNHEDDLEIP